MPLQQGWPPSMTDYCEPFCCSTEHTLAIHVLHLTVSLWESLGVNRSVTESRQSVLSVPSTEIYGAKCHDKRVIFTIKTAAYKSLSGQWTTKVKSSVRCWWFGGVGGARHALGYAIILSLLIALFGNYFYIRLLIISCVLVIYCYCLHSHIYYLSI